MPRRLLLERNVKTVTGNPSNITDPVTPDPAELLAEAERLGGGVGTEVVLNDNTFRVNGDTTVTIITGGGGAPAFKGTHLSLGALQAAHPTANPGDYADVDAGVGQDITRYIWDDDDEDWKPAVGNIAGETAASIKTKYESNADTNAFTDAEKSLLGALPISIVMPVTGETENLAALTDVFTMRAPFAFLLTEVRASVSTAPVGSAAQIRVKKNGATVLTTDITIDDGEETSESAATSPVIDAAQDDFADDDEITVDIVAIGSTTAGAGLKVTLNGTRA